MKYWFFLLCGAIVTWSFVDVNSESSFYNFFLPLLFVVFVLLILLNLSPQNKRGFSRSDSFFTLGGNGNNDNDGGGD